MQKELVEALIKEIAFVAIGMRQKQFAIAFRGEDLTVEEAKWIGKVVNESLNCQLTSDYWNAGKPENKGQEEGSSQALPS